MKRRGRLVVVAEPQAFTAERPGILERLGKLAGATGWRQPVEGTGTARRTLPTEHELAMALGMARTSDPSDIGPDVAFDMATNSSRHQVRVCAALSATLDAMHREHRAIGRNRPYLRIVAFAGYARLVFGQDVAKPDGMADHDWDTLTEIAERVMSASADEAIWRAGRALSRRKEAGESGS